MNEHILRLARENAPCFIYSRDVLARQATLLRDTFPVFDFLFSVKANPFPPVMRALAALGIPERKIPRVQQELARLAPQLEDVLAMEALAKQIARQLL